MCLVYFRKKDEANLGEYRATLRERKALSRLSFRDRLLL